MTELETLQQFFELSTDLLCVASSDGYLKRVNRAFSETLGYSRAELLSRPFLERVYSEDRAQTQAQVDRLRASRVVLQFQNRWYHKDGSLRWLEWNASASQSVDGEIIFHCAAREISQRKILENLRESLHLELEGKVEQATREIELYVNLFQNVPLPLNIWQLENRDNARSLFLRYSNPAAIQATGIDGQTMVGQSILNCFPGLEDAELQRYAQVARGEIGKQNYQLNYADRTGLTGIFEVRLFPLPNCCLGIAFEDVTQAVRMKQQLRDSEQHFRTIFEQAAVGIARIDASRRWIEVNDRLCEMLDYEQDVLLGKAALDIVDPRDRQKDVGHYRQLTDATLTDVRPADQNIAHSFSDEHNQDSQHQALQNQNHQTQDSQTQDSRLAQSCSFEERYLRSDGTSFWVLVAVTALRNEQNQITSFILTVQDIDERKANEIERTARARELRRLNHELSRATKALKRRNHELDQFAYVVSHDLKAPLRALSSLAGWIAEDNVGKLTEESDRHLELMQKRVIRMGNLLDGLLEYSRIGRVNAEPTLVSVGPLLNGILDSLQPPEGFQIDIVEPMPTLEAREISLSQVLTNLISNAIRYCDRPDGRLRISVRETREAHVFTLADNGPGIAPQHHERIFEIFQTLQPRDKSESTGVGLSIVKKIIAVEQGSIWLEPTPAEGASFHFAWPKANSRLK